MKYPWVPICAAFVAGILLAPLDPEQIEPLRIGLILTGVSACGAALWGKRLLSIFFALAAFVLAGAALHTTAMTSDDPDYLPNLKKNEILILEEPLELVGAVQRHPERRRDKLEMVVAVEKYFQRGRWRDGSGRVLMRTYLTPTWQDRALPFRTGDMVRCFTSLSSPRSPGNPGGFDYALYLHRQGINHTCSVKSPMAVEIISRGNGLPGASELSSLRAALGDLIRRHFSPAGVLSERGALLQAMLLGCRGMISDDTKLLLRRAGLLHIIAISGYHVWVLGLICFLLLRAIRVPDRWASLFIIAVLVSYWAIAGGRSSAGRACIVGIIFLLGRVFYRKPNALNILAFAAFAILLFNPAEIFNYGFLLTFAAALAIVVLYRPLNRLLEPLGWIGSILALSLAVQVGILPLTALLFNIVTIHGALTTALLLPAVSLVIMLGFLFLFAASIMPAVGDILASIISFLLGTTLEAANLFDTLLPLAVRLPAPPLWLLIAYVVALALWITLSRFTERKVIPALPFASLLLLFILNPFTGPPRSDYRLHMIDVGQGESLLLEQPDGKAALVDGGGSPISGFDVGEHIVSTFLWHRGHREIDLMVSTHSDSDHIEGLVQVACNFRVRELWITSAAEDNQNLQRLLRIARKQGTLIKRVTRGRNLKWGVTNWTCMNPPAVPYRGRDSSNNNSLVARVEFGGHRLLLTGDAESGTLAEIGEQFAGELNCDVLKIPHHGSDDSLSEGFVNEANPRMALISAGYENIHGFPRQAVLDALSARQIKLLRTDLHGAVSLTFSAGEITAHTWR